MFCPPPTLLRTTGCEDPASELPDLRLLYVGGEALPDDLVERWARGRRLVNGYGPTECTVTVVRGDVRVGETVTIGDPVPGHTAWVLDTDLCEVPRGEPGELCLAGIGLARGYRNRPEVTAEKFPTHPILGRIYRTGDLVTQNPDGSYNYLGRIDGQVKLRGYRVELEAVEAHLAAFDHGLHARTRELGDAIHEEFVEPRASVMRLDRECLKGRSGEAGAVALVGFEFSHGRDTGHTRADGGASSPARARSTAAS